MSRQQVHVDCNLNRNARQRGVIPEASGRLEVLHRDDNIVVVDKPPGMLTHVHPADPQSPNVRAVLEGKLQRPVYTVHRLDRMTSGLMVIALTRETARLLASQFAERSVVKQYRAIVRGHTPETGTISHPLAKDTGESAAAETLFRTIARGTVHEPVGRYDEAWFSLLELTLSTGRRHQARRHLHRIDHPVIGDNRHGDKAYNRWATNRMGVRALYLRASRLRFLHPTTSETMDFTLANPELWDRICQIIFPAEKGLG